MRNWFYLVFILIVLGCSDTSINNQISDDNAASNIVAPAELVSLQEVSVTPPTIRRTWEFKIEFLARENSLVKAGDVIIRFDAQRQRNDLITRKSELDAQIKEADRLTLENEAKLEQLTLDMAEARKNMDIAKRKVEITDVSRSEIERKKQKAEFEITTELYKQAQQRVELHKTTIQVSQQVQQAMIDNAQTQVNEVEEAIEKMNVKALKDGMVTLVPNGDDEKPSVGDTVFMGRRILSLPSLDQIAVKVEFDESATAYVNEGDKVRVTLDAYPELNFEGRVTELGQSYRNKSRNNLKVVFDAWVTLDNLDLDIMRPGMKASVELVESNA